MKYFKRICWSVIALALIICISMETPVRFGAFSSPSVQRVAVGGTDAGGAGRFLAVVYNVARSRIAEIAQDGVIELYFDSYSYSIAVYETISGNYWYMMPQAETVQSPSNASVLSFDIELDGELHTVDSQDNSLALGGASYELITSDSGTSGIRVHYDFCYGRRA